MDQQRRAELRAGWPPPPGPFRPVGGDPDVARLAAAHGRVERAHRLLERRVGVEAVRVEDVDVVEAHPAQALLEAREQVLARAPLAVGAGPHVVAGLGRDHELVAERRKSSAMDAPEVDLGAAVGRPVVVGQVEVGDAEVERAAQDRAAVGQRAVVAEVLPQPERDRRQLAARCARSAGRASARSGPPRGRRRSVRGGCCTAPPQYRNSRALSYGACAPACRSRALRPCRRRGRSSHRCRRGSHCRPRSPPPPARRGPRPA